MGCVASKTEIEQKTVSQAQQDATPRLVEIETTQPSGPKDPALVVHVSSPQVSIATEADIHPTPEEDPTSTPSQALRTVRIDDLSILIQEEAGPTHSMQSMATLIDSPSDPALNSLQTLRDTHNAHENQAFDENRLRAFVSSTFSEDDDELTMTRSIYLSSKSSAERPVSQGRHTGSLTLGSAGGAKDGHAPMIAPITEAPPSPLPSSGMQKKPPSPAAGVDRKRVGAVISPGKRLLVRKPLVSEQRGELDDFAMDGEDGATERPPAASSSSTLPVSPNLRAVSLPARKPPQHFKSTNLAADTSTPAPASKRGFLHVSESRSPRSKSYHVLDGGTLYQIDGVSKVQASPYGMDNKAISLRHTSIDVRDHVIDIIAEPGLPNSPSRRVVSFEVRNEEERQQWVQALQQHINYSGSAGAAE